MATGHDPPGHVQPNTPRPALPHSHPASSAPAHVQPRPSRNHSIAEPPGKRPTLRHGHTVHHLALRGQQGRSPLIGSPHRQSIGTGIAPAACDIRPSTQARVGGNHMYQSVLLMHACTTCTPHSLSTWNRRSAAPPTTLPRTGCPFHVALKQYHAMPVMYGPRGKPHAWLRVTPAPRPGASLQTRLPMPYSCLTGADCSTACAYCEDRQLLPSRPKLPALQPILPSITATLKRNNTRLQE